PRGLVTIKTTLRASDIQTHCPLHHYLQSYWRFQPLDFQVELTPPLALLRGSLVSNRSMLRQMSSLEWISTSSASKEFLRMMTAVRGNTLRFCVQFKLTLVSNHVPRERHCPTRSRRSSAPSTFV